MPFILAKTVSFHYVCFDYKLVVYKRLGDLSEQLGIFEYLRNFLLEKINAVYAPLDPSLRKKGNHHSKWKIIDNIEINSLIKSNQT